MKDWAAIAKAAGLDIPAKDLSRTSQALNAWTRLSGRWPPA
jgi:hypothetical protein